ncbi:uncharacterized protein Tco025E_00743 [Trypanosoma conorhini]|uniref:Ubiquitin-like domain-containing protein n=1 Tax=Trypanosoma conorhini TaxID=83891 RepID=A0A3R7LLK4_9TRYP|nr:uncharacterized protein Tco025E_00743 [Trypanosoma conorhini]RNF27085.1 hypothetical protein Tco025E_00743 [Trypanosoma conorhini]
MRSARADLSSAPGEQRSTLRVRNPASGVVYHLIFEGNLRRLTGAQLRLHLEGICLVPAERQRLTFNGVPVDNESTGASLGLHDRALLELHTAPRGGPGDVLLRGAQYAHPAEEHLNHSERSEQPHGLSTPTTTTASQRTPTPRAMQRDVEDASAEVRHPRWRYAYGKDDCGGPRLARNVCAAAPLLGAPPAQTLEPVDAVIEEDAIEGLSAAMMPLHDADIEDARLEQMEYVWMMEQMRFETERMNRERDLLRQRQELEYEAEILEREQCIVGRRTLQERRKLAELQQWVREEMAVEARLLNIRDSGLSYGNRDDDHDESIDLTAQEEPLR